jgi:SAM-dependent methyltransferase
LEQGTDTRAAASANAEMAEAWSGVMFERFSRFRPVVSGGLRPFGEAALAAWPPAAGDRVLDLGCGWGETTRRLAELADGGSVVGVDLSPPFLAVARREAEEAGAANVEFRVEDVQEGELGGPFDYAFSRMGIMFFSDPVRGLANVRAALRPGGRLVAVVWRRKPDNEWVHRSQLAVERHLDPPPAPAGPDPAPGPYSMADADLLTEHLIGAGFEAVTLRRCDLPLRIGADLDAAVEFGMALGPSGEILRHWGERADALRPAIAAEIRAALADLVGPDGVWAPASTWLLSARAPEE